MKSRYLPTGGAGRGTARVLLSLALAGVLFLSAGRAEAPPAAGTLVRNQSVATFNWQGLPFHVLSNEVVTEVLGVHGFEIIPDGTVADPAHDVRAAAGISVYLPYLLTNTGNITDRYLLSLPDLPGGDFVPSGRAFYLDENASGTPDPGEGLMGNLTPPVPSGESIRLLVRLDIPVTAAAGQSAWLDLVGVSTGDPALPPDTENVMKVTVTDRAVMTLAKRPSVTETAPGGVITYTLDALNTGGAPAHGRPLTVDGVARTGILVQSEIPEHASGGTFYLAGSLVAGPPGYRPLFSVDGGLTWTETEPADPDTVTNVGYLLETEILPGQSVRLEFETRVDPGRGPGPLFSRGILSYAEELGVLEVTVRADAMVLVRVPAALMDVFIGPENDPRAAVGGDTNADFTVAPGLGPAAPGSGLPDNAEVIGNAVIFRNTIENAGPGPDTINVEVDPAFSNLPAGWGVMLLRADGLTPLTDSSGDGRRDVGILAPGQQVTITVRVHIPAGADPGDNGGQGFVTVLRASPASAPAVFNLTSNIIGHIIPAAQAWGPIVKSQQVPARPEPGDTVLYTLEFSNASGTPMTGVALIDELSPDLVNPRGLTQGAVPDLDDPARTVTVAGNYDPAPPRRVAWNIAELPPGFRGRVSFEADFAGGLPPGTEVLNNFAIISAQAQTAHHSNTVSAAVGVDRALVIEKTAGRDTVEVGDPLRYTISFSNAGVSDLDDTVLTDRLPRGLRYDPGTATLDGVPLEPDISPDGRTLTWAPGPLPAGAARAIRYTCLVTPDALRGDGRNYAVLSGTFPLGTPVSVSDEHRVRVTEGPFANRSIIFGRVFLDQNDNRVQDAGEPGIAGVRLYLEDGTWVMTDREGRFHFEGIGPGMRVLRLDQSTLDPDLVPAHIDSTNACSPVSRFVDLRFGTPHKANFRVLSREQLDAELLSMLPETRRNRLEPVALETDGRVTRVTVRAGEPVETLAVHDTVTGTVSIQLPGVAPGPGAMPGRTYFPADGNVEEIRVHDDPDGRQVKVQVRLRRGTGGYPAVDIRREEKGAVLAIGESREKITPPRDIPATGAPGTAGEGPGPAFLSPREGEAFVSRGRVNVRVTCHLAAAFDLFVNGQPVDKSRIGETSYTVSERRAVYEYVGVPLEPGANRLRLVARAPGRDEDETAEITVHRSAAPVSVAVEAVPARPPADGRTEPVLTVTLLDAAGIATGTGSVVTLHTDQGEFLSPDLRPVESGHQAQVLDGTARVRLSAADRPETREIKVEAGGLEHIFTLNFQPDLRDWIVTGVLSATATRREERDEAAGIEERTRTVVDDRLAFFARGRLPGDILMTAAYDGDREDDGDELFRERDPLEYYAVYGDESEQKHDAESRDKLFLKLERADSHLMWGDFRTGLDRVRMAAYERAFTGGRADLRGRWLSFAGFYSRNDQAAIRADIPGRGVSGYYQLPDRHLVVNSEQVVIETRDRLHPERVVESVTRRRHADYTIDYETGRIMFRRPVPSVDRDLNPVFIVVRYEVDGRLGRSRAAFGGRAAAHDPDGRFELGVTRVVEEGEPRDYTLEGLDARVRLAPGLELRAERAQTRTVEGLGDRAHLVELTGERERAEFRAWHEEIGAGFENPGRSGGGAGTRSYGLDGDFRVGERLRFRDQLYARRNPGAGTASDVIIHDNIFTFKRVELLLGGGYVREKEPVAGGGAATRSGGIARAGAGLDLGGRWRFEALHQQALGDTTVEQPTLARADLSFQADERTRAYLGGERRRSVAGGSEHNLALGVERQLGSHLRGFQELSVAGAADGRRIASGSGLDLRLPVSPEVTFEATGEISRALAGGNLPGAGRENAWALTIGATHRPSDRSHAAAGRVEVRGAPESTAWLFELGGTRRLNYNHSLFGRNIYTLSRSRTAGAGGEQSLDLRLGWAYRPVDDDRLMVLADARVKTERGGDASEGRLQRYLLSSELHYQPSARAWLETKYAARLARAGYARTSPFSDLKALRLQYDFSDPGPGTLFVAAGLRMLSTYSTETRDLSYGLEFGGNLSRGLRLAVGYNFSGFRDRDFTGNDNWERGFYVGLHWKFDESILGFLRRLENDGGRQP